MAGAPSVKPFTGAALPLSPSDWSTAARQLGCDEAAVRAVAEVEAPGSGFLPNRRPRILFEAHIFSGLTGHRYDATHPAISSARWNRALYAGGEREYDRLAAAIALNRTAALEAASWGRFQILGRNYRQAGFADVESFVRAMCGSERAQLDAFVSFIRNNQTALTALRAHDWSALARVYNGPSYHNNHYDTRLEQAYRRLVTAGAPPRVPVLAPRILP